MIKSIAESLFLRVYDSVTAVISISEAGQVTDVTQFDTLFGTEDRIVRPGTSVVCVVCNHPEGRTILTGEEIRNCRRVFTQSGRAEVRVYIFGEDIGLMEVDKRAILDYNGENAG